MDNEDLVDKLRQNLIGSWETLSATLTSLETKDKENVHDAEIVHVLTETPNGNLIYSADGWMSALLQKPASLLPKYTASTIGGTDEESAAVMRGTQPYAGMWGIEEGSVSYVEIEDGASEREERGYLSKLRKGKRTGWVKFRLYHDIKIGAPVNWIGQKQVRVGEMWEEDEEGEGKDGKRKRLFMSLHADFPVVVEGREWMVAAGWRKRS